MLVSAGTEACDSVTGPFVRLAQVEGNGARMRQLRVSRIRPYIGSTNRLISLLTNQNGETLSLTGSAGFQSAKASPEAFNDSLI